MARQWANSAASVQPPTPGICTVIRVEGCAAAIGRGGAEGRASALRTSPIKGGWEWGWTVGEVSPGDMECDAHSTGIDFGGT